MTKQQLPAVSLLTSETLEDFKTTDDVVVVAYISADDKSSNQTYTALAESLRDEYIFGGSNDASLAKAEGVKQPAIVLYKDFDEDKNTFDESFDEEAWLIGKVIVAVYIAFVMIVFALARSARHWTLARRMET